MRFTDAIRSVYRRHGAGGVLFKGLTAGARRIFFTNSAWWFSRQIDKSLAVPEDDPRVSVVCDRPAETIAWLKACSEDFAYNEREMAVALEEKHILSHIRLDKKIIGYLKVGIGALYLSDYKRAIDLSPGEAMIYDTYIAPAYRGKRLAHRLISATLVYMREKGYREVVCHIPPGNAASLAAYRAAGFRRRVFVRHIHLLNCFGFEITRA
ncbi:MAG: GNAT family N-acetyltransferase [Candidatus Omnitrophica bacterium]|nr:GNAT family N-acetyltransferase [Candidatus Omnitrophota bacterium]